MLISFQDPTHEAGLYGMTCALYEHLNLATTQSSLGRDDFQYFPETLTVDDFNGRYPDRAITDTPDPRLNRVYSVLLYRKVGDVSVVEPVFYFRPTYVVDNHRKYAQPTDRKFFANLFNYVDFRFIDTRPEVTRFVTQYFLSGMPWPNRRL